MNLTHTHEFLITHITDSGTGFGVRTDNGESVHISPRLLQQAHANLDDICIGIIVQNAVEEQRERTPWVAAYVQERRAARDVRHLWKPSTGCHGKRHSFLCGETLFCLWFRQWNVVPDVCGGHRLSV